MGKPYMCTIVDSSGRDCVLISFQFDGLKTGFFEVSLFWVGQYKHLPSVYAGITIQFLRNLYK